MERQKKQSKEVYLNKPFMLLVALNLLLDFKYMDELNLSAVSGFVVSKWILSFMLVWTGSNKITKYLQIDVLKSLLYIQTRREDLKV